MGIGQDAGLTDVPEAVLINRMLDAFMSTICAETHDTGHNKNRNAYKRITNTPTAECGGASLSWT
jgi:hypothetical protein